MKCNTKRSSRPHSLQIIECVTESPMQPDKTGKVLTGEDLIIQQLMKINIKDNKNKKIDNNYDVENSLSYSPSLNDSEFIPSYSNISFKKPIKNNSSNLFILHNHPNSTKSAKEINNKDKNNDYNCFDTNSHTPTKKLINKSISDYKISQTISKNINKKKESDQTAANTCFTTQYTNTDKNEFDKTGLRFDKRGIIIEKGSKKHRITFKDNMPGSEGLIEYVKVESYKKNNAANNFERNFNSGRKVACCIFF
jgi:hypothetical protein